MVPRRLRSLRVITHDVIIDFQSTFWMDESFEYDFVSITKNIQRVRIGKSFEGANRLVVLYDPTIKCFGFGFFFFTDRMDTNGYKIT